MLSSCNPSAMQEPRSRSRPRGSAQVASSVQRLAGDRPSLGPVAIPEVKLPEHGRSIAYEPRDGSLAAPAEAGQAVVDRDCAALGGLAGRTVVEHGPPERPGLLRGDLEAQRLEPVVSPQHAFPVDVRYRDVRRARG